MALKCNLTQDEISQIKAKFSAWMDLQDEKKQLSDAESDLKEDAAKIIDGKKKDVSLLFKAMKAIYNGEDNDLDEVGGVLETIQANGSEDEDE